MMRDESSEVEYFIGKDIETNNFYCLTNLIKLLKLNKFVSLSYWSTFLTIRKLLLDNKLKLVSSKWYDDFSQKNIELFPLDIHKESTFEECLDMEIYYEGTIRIRVVVYDGDMRARRVRKRSEYILEVVEWDSLYNPVLDRLIEQQTKTILKEEERKRKENLYQKAKQKVLNMLEG